MKRILMAIGLGMCILLAGCGGNTDLKQSNNTQKSDSKEEAADIKAIKDRGVIIAGVKADVPKYGIKNPETNEYEGIEIDISKAVAKKLFGDENKIKFVTVTAKTKGPFIDTGEVDFVCANMTITEERKKSYNFTEPYIADPLGFIVKKSSNFSTFKDLESKTVGVPQGSTVSAKLKAEVEKQGINVKVAEYTSLAECKTALDSGRIDVFSNNISTLGGYLDDTVELLNDTYEPEYYGICSKKGNDGLSKLLNEVIKEMKDSGELDKLKEKWELKG